MKRILFLDDHVPYPELGVGYPRTRRLLQALDAAGHALTFLPLECPDDDWQSLKPVVPGDVEVILGISAGQLASFLNSRNGHYDLVFVSRPNNMRRLLAAFDEIRAPGGNVPILYDAEAVFAAREALRHAVEGAPLTEDERSRILESEMQLARAASHVVAVSDEEAATFRRAGCVSVGVVGYGLELAPTATSCSDRKDILFVGALDDDPSPNVDALVWFVQQVLPQIRDGLSASVRLVVAGRCGAHRVRALAEADVVLLGMVDNLDATYDAARVFIAPHRYAAGIPLKVLEAAARGVPCVTSDLIARQLGWRHGVELLSAGTAQDCARSIIRLYQDERLWIDIRNGALHAVSRDHSEESFRDAVAASLEQACAGRRRRRPTWISRLLLRGLGRAHWLRQRAHLRQIARSRWFDERWYLTMYPDVAASGLDPALHYLLHGAAEGRDPGPGFSTAGYLARHPDVATSGINPLLHYLEVGAEEASLIGSRNPKRSAVRALCISGEPTEAGHDYRVMNLARALAGAGAERAWMTIEEAASRPQDVAAAGLLVLWRTAWDDRVRRIARAARAGGAAVLFDVDDLIIEPRLARASVIDGIRTQGLSERQVETYYQRVLTSFEAADWACCPTEELAVAMRRRGMPTFVIPNGFDERAHRQSRLAVRRRRATGGDGLLRIGYAAGTPTHQRDFARVANSIASILHERSDSRLVLFRHRETGEPLLDPTDFGVFRGLENRIEWRDFVSRDRLPDEIARFDVNIAPLEVGNPFCEAKSELKFFEAALVDVCTVASPTGPFHRAIRHGETGFLAADPAAWTSILRRLLENSELRRRVGRAAYRDVLWSYGPHRRAELAASMLDQILGDARTAARAFALDGHPHRRAGAFLVPNAEVVFEADRLGEAEVTVVVPLYNYRRFVIEALDSVAAQTLEAIDLVVVDDASTDDSFATAAAWMRANAARFNRALLLRNAVNAGLGPTRNVAVDSAETPFVLPLDADDRLLPEACDSLLKAIRDAGAAFAYPILKQFEDGDAIMGMAPYAAQRFVGGNYIDATALIRKDCWAAVGGYADIRQGWEDFDFWCRLAERGWWGRQVPKILVEHRVHADSMQHTVTHLPANQNPLVALMQERHPWLSLVHGFPDPAGSTGVKRTSPAAEIATPALTSHT